MGLICRLTRHKPVPSYIWNDGYYFTRCSSCGCEMIGRGGMWRPVPRGYRVVWKKPTTESIHWKPFAPAIHEGARLSDMVDLYPHGRAAA
ncbi:MAG: hypothetical protein ACM3YM_09900 [Sphingomonadales bacterium]